jgi:hypothetical protein
MIFSQRERLAGYGHVLAFFSGLAMALNLSSFVKEAVVLHRVKVAYVSHEKLGGRASYQRVQVSL